MSNEIPYCSNQKILRYLQNKYLSSTVTMLQPVKHSWKIALLRFVSQFNTMKIQEVIATSLIARIAGSTNWYFFIVFPPRQLLGSHHSIIITQKIKLMCLLGKQAQSKTFLYLIVYLITNFLDNSIRKI